MTEADQTPVPEVLKLRKNDPGRVQYEERLRRATNSELKVAALFQKAAGVPPLDPPAPLYLWQAQELSSNANLRMDLLRALWPGYALVPPQPPEVS